MKNIDVRCTNALRVFGAEMITNAKSGHPGIVLGSAPILHTLYTRHINVNGLIVIVLFYQQVMVLHYFI